MKTAVAITLIIGGVVIIAIPPLACAWRALLVTQAITHGAMLGLEEGDIGDDYRIACVLLGTAMIAIGVISSLSPAVESVLRPGRRVADAR